MKKNLNPLLAIVFCLPISFSYAENVSFIDNGAKPGVPTSLDFRTYNIDDRPWGLSIGVPHDKGYSWTTIQLDEIGNDLLATTANFEDTRKSDDGSRKLWTDDFWFTPTFKSFSKLALEKTFFNDTEGVGDRVFRIRDSSGTKINDINDSAVSSALQRFYKQNTLSLHVLDLYKFFTFNEFKLIAEAIQSKNQRVNIILKRKPTLRELEKNPDSRGQPYRLGLTISYELIERIDIENLITNQIIFRRSAK